MIALNAVKSELFGEGGGAEVQAAQLLDGLQDVARRRPRALGLERPAPAPGPRDARSRSRATSPTRRCPRAAPATWSSTTARSSRSRRPAPTPPRAASASMRRQASNVLMVAGKRSRSGHPLFVGGPQIGYFYPGLTLEMDLHGPGWTRPRRHLGAVPGLHPDRPPRGLRLDAHLGGRGHRRHLRRDALRRQRHQVPLQGQVPLDDAVQRGHASTARPVDLQPHRARARDRLRDRRRHARGDLAQALELPARRRRPAAVPAPHARQGPQRARLHQGRRDLAADVQHVLRRQRRGRARSRPGACRSGPRASTPGLPTDGRGSYEWRGFLHGQGPPARRSCAAACSTTGTTSPRAGSPPPTTSGPTGRSAASTCSTATRTRSSEHTLATLTGAMNAAATQDVRAITFVPLLSRGAARAVRRRAPRATRMLELLEAWRAKGGSRLDRDLDGKIDDPGAAVLDTAWDAPGGRRAGAGAGPAARRPAQRHPAPPLRPAAGRPVRRLAHVHEQGPAHAARQAGEGPVRATATAATATWPPAGPRCGPRSTPPARELAASPGAEPGRLARGRHARADHVPAGPAALHDALHQPARAGSSR